MQWIGQQRPRVTRETRLLVTTALLAVVALWMLARLRFPTPPTAPRVLAGLVDGRLTEDGFDVLARHVARVDATVRPHLVALQVGDAASVGASSARAALRIDDTTAIAYLPEHEVPRHGTVSTIARDSASRLAVLRVRASGTTLAAMPRMAAGFAASQFLLASVAHADGVAMRPTFIPAFSEVDAPLWSSSAWALPASADVPPGAFLFNRDGELVGMVIDHHNSPAVVPAAALLREAQRLREAPHGGTLDVGIDVQPLTPRLARALGADAGVAVSWVDPSGPALGRLRAGDVIDAADGMAMPTVDHWRRHVAATKPHLDVTLSVLSRGVRRTVTVVPTATRRPASATTGGAALGATLVSRSTGGTEVTEVVNNSVASRAGLRVGDRITMLDATPEPTPAHLMDAVERLRTGQSRVIAVRRGDRHELLVLER